MVAATNAVPVVRRFEVKTEQRGLIAYTLTQKPDGAAVVQASVAESSNAAYYPHGDEHGLFSVAVERGGEVYAFSWNPEAHAAFVEAFPSAWHHVLYPVAEATTD